ncbi:MAG: hypothetical protein M1517_10075 [Deltaproteobacteria bacterium]|nr:hypothetical protein [Deltaproteobacteria bacterium]
MKRNKKNNIKYIVKRVLPVIIFIISISGLTIYDIWPRVSIQIGESLNPHNPFETPFIIKNEGNSMLKQIQYFVLFKEVDLLNSTKLINISIIRPNDVIPQLNVNESSTVFINNDIGVSPDFVIIAKIYINLTYKAHFIPFYKFTKSIKFEVSRKNNGEYVWFEYASDKEIPYPEGLLNKIKNKVNYKQ